MDIDRDEKRAKSGGRYSLVWGTACRTPEISDESFVSDRWVKINVHGSKYVGHLMVVKHSQLKIDST